MASQANMEKIAHYAFLAFVIIAIVAGLAFGAWAYSINNTYPLGYTSTWSNSESWVLLIMLILGIIVGLISIATKEVQLFLTLAIALIVASTANIWAPLASIHADILSYWADSILKFIVAFVAPAAVIIAIRGVIELERKK